MTLFHASGLRRMLLAALILQCEAACRSRCETRADCKSPYDDCNAATQTCQPDAVTVAAAQFGVQPMEWKPPLAATLEQEAIDLILPTTTNAQTPLMGFVRCQDRVTACRMATHQADQCVAGTPRCASDHPWRKDPAGPDCCPSACLLEYFELRKTNSPVQAFLAQARSQCYPGMDQPTRGDQ